MLPFGSRVIIYKKSVGWSILVQLLFRVLHWRIKEYSRSEVMCVSDTHKDISANE